MLTVVYANPCVTSRKPLWRYLDSIRGCFQLPWLIAGDFNEIICNSEKRGGRSKFSNSGFAAWIDRNCLVDMGFIGSKFTWMTKRGIGEEIWERLDRAICSMDWRLCYAEGFVKHLPRVVSDHCPILIHLYSNQIPKCDSKPFRFEAMWMKHMKFHEVVHNHWRDYKESVGGKLQAFADVLRVWNKETFGNIFHNKRRLLARIQGVQKCLSNNYAFHLAILEEKLVSEYSNVLEQEEVFWQQKSRNCWLKEGDRNTSFFHMSTVVRRRRNKLEGLKRDDGVWLEDIVDMKKEAVRFFITLFEKK